MNSNTSQSGAVAAWAGRKPDFSDVLAAAKRIAPHAHVTPVLQSRSLDALAGAQLHFKCENFQRVGAFKFRGACNAVWSLGDAEAAHGVVTHSSGNHGAALALAAHTRGIAAHVVVPEGAVKSKLAAIKAYGATLHVCAPNMAAREAMAAAVQESTGARLVHPFTDPAVIAGQGTAALEMLEQVGALDMRDHAGRRRRPGRRHRAGRRGRQRLARACSPRNPRAPPMPSSRCAAATRVTDLVPHTVCDGLRGTIGEINFDLLRAHRVEVLLVSDAETLAAMRLVWERMKILIEPSCATVLAAVLRNRERFAGQRVGLVLSGGNVDLDALPGWG